MLYSPFESLNNFAAQNELAAYKIGHKKVRTQQVEPSQDQVRPVQYARALFEV